MSRAMALLIAIIGGSSVAYYFAENGAVPYMDCVYMAVITVSTVGFNEVIPIDTAFLRVLTMVLIVTGTGGLLYFGSLVTSFIIEGDLNDWLNEGSMERKIAKLKNHVIVCGIGATGRHAAKELFHSGIPFVMIDLDSSKLTTVERQLETTVNWIVGDAEADEVLERAGIVDARAIICALPSDRDNLFLVVTARKLAPDILIVSRVVDDSSAVKLSRAGADEIVSPNMIGGRRMAFEVVRPQATGFLELMMTEQDRVMRIEEIVVHAGSKLAGRTLATSDLRRVSDVLVIGVRTGEKNSYAPGPEFRLDVGMVLIVFGEISNIQQAAKLGAGPDGAPSRKYR